MNRKWILIGDGQRVKILEKHNGELRNIGATHHAEDHPTFKDKGHHAPGTNGKHSYAPHEDWGMFEVHNFVEKIAHLINRRHSDFEELMLIAPAKIVGELKPQLNKEVAGKVVSELHKDYTHTPIDEIKDLF